MFANEGVNGTLIQCINCEARSKTVFEKNDRKSSLATSWNRRAGGKWACKADRSGVGGNTPQDCDWPGCGCDPYADSVLEALREAGHLTSADDLRRVVHEAVAKAFEDEPKRRKERSEGETDASIAAAVWPGR